MRAQNSSSTDIPADSFQVSLLTCSPSSEEAYTLFGHTAIRCRDWRHGSDWVFNYGVFNFKQPYFIPRFLLGLTDYELGVLPFSVFINEYKREGRSVTEQILNLSTLEKQTLYRSLIDNYEHESLRVYRYNFLSANCTTKARDIIGRCIDGTVQYTHIDAPYPSTRALLHELTSSYRWATMTNDLCLGALADIPSTYEACQFLPLQLMNDFSEAQISDTQGQRRLVSATYQLLPATSVAHTSAAWFTPTLFGLLLLSLITALSIMEERRQRCFVAVDILLFTLISIVGLLLWLLLFSQHPTTSTNLQCLLFHPLPLLFLRALYRNNATRFWDIELCMLILFFLGWFIQDYAEGVLLIGICLLLRCYVHRHQLSLYSRILGLQGSLFNLIKYSR
ncbi:MAG: DUF4105 domain-containing protein [Prevotella sp.]|nr:DUF4105 domain-containing protein [Prevotella sp.]